MSCNRIKKRLDRDTNLLVAVFVNGVRRAVFVKIIELGLHQSELSVMPVQIHSGIKPVRAIIKKSYPSLL